MNEEFDSSERLGNKGFYIALLLCICVIAGARRTRYWKMTRRCTGL